MSSGALDSFLWDIRQKVTILTGKVFDGCSSLSGSPSELWKAYVLKFLDSYSYFALSLIFTIFLTAGKLSQCCSKQSLNGTMHHTTWYTVEWLPNTIFFRRKCRIWIFRYWSRHHLRGMGSSYYCLWSDCRIAGGQFGCRQEFATGIFLESHLKVFYFRHYIPNRAVVEHVCFTSVCQLLGDTRFNHGHSPLYYSSKSGLCVWPLLCDYECGCLAERASGGYL